MAKLVWDKTGPRQFTSGVDRGVYYPTDSPGEVWNGLASVKESPSDTDVRTRYVDGLPTRRASRPGSFAGSIEAYTYPDVFEEDVAGRRFPKTFGLSYRVQTNGSYKIHILYNVLVKKNDQNYEQEDPSIFSWDFTTKPITIPDARTTAHLVIDASVAYPWTLEALENALYGSEEAESRLPSPTEVIDIFDVNSILRVIDNGDGTWTATGPDEAFDMLDTTTFEITWPSAIFIDEETYELSSL